MDACPTVRPERSFEGYSRGVRVLAEDGEGATMSNRYSDFDRMRRLAYMGRYLFGTVSALMAGGSKEYWKTWLEGFEAEAEENCAAIEIKDGYLWVLFEEEA